MPCQAMQPASHAAHLASRDHLLSQDHRTRDRELGRLNSSTRHIPLSSSPSLALGAHPFLHLFLPPYTKPCREAVIVAGVEAARTVEGGSVELVVVPLLEAEVAAVGVASYGNRAGMSRSRSSVILLYSNSCLASIFAEGQAAVIDSRLANSAEDRLISSFKSLSLRQDAMPPRPDYGIKG